jgi:hypothetical protein
VCRCQQRLIAVPITVAGRSLVSDDEGTEAGGAAEVGDDLQSFGLFVRLNESGLRIALMVRYGPERGREATSEALAHAWEKRVVAILVDGNPRSVRTVSAEPNREPGTHVQSVALRVSSPR